MLFTVKELENPHIVYAQNIMRVPLALTAIAETIIAMYVVSDFEPMPEGLRGTLNSFAVFSAIYLSGLAYGMVNDLFACSNNIGYFVNGHNQGQEKGLVKTNDFVANAAIWGILATWWLALPAGILFGLSAGISYASGAPFAPFLMLAIPVISICTAIGADIASRKHQNKLIAAGHSRESATWEGNNRRNTIGYFTLPPIACGGLIILTIINALIGADIIPVHEALMSNEMQAAAYSFPAGIVALGLIYFYLKCAFLSAFPHYQSNQFLVNYSKEIQDRAAALVLKKEERLPLAGNYKPTLISRIGRVDDHEDPELGRKPVVAPAEKPDDVHAEIATLTV